MNVDVPRLLALLGITARNHGHGDYWAKCPSHDDKEASWHISDPLGIHFCFGCHFGGDAVDLAAEVIECTRGGAFDWMSEKALFEHDTAPLDVEVVVRAVRNTGFKLPPGVSGAPFERWPSVVRNYVLGRGITHEQAVRWSLMYALDGALAGRVVFPIFDRFGSVISYTARTFIDEEPRYKNPRAADKADPRALFGQQWWTAERRRVVVAEGAINALAWERSGARNIAALGGSRITHEQVLALAGFARIDVATDEDTAGERISEELNATFGRWRDVRRVCLGNGKDAADSTDAERKAALLNA